MDPRGDVQRPARGRGGGGPAGRAGLRGEAVRSPCLDRADEADRSSLISADRHLERWVVHHRTGWLNPVFEGLSWAGRLGLLWIALALLLSVLWRRWGVLFMTLFAVAVSDWLAMGLKALVDRPRPPLRYVEPKVLVPLPHDASFPSGHAATSFAAATMLSFASPRLAPIFYLLATAVAFSRVYVGVHYPLDVIGGAALGTLVALGVRYVVRRTGRVSRAAALR
ncbi:MAG: phosphatase PAP2 family protein [Actinobacteria bacterium]|nr:MAG: phosphatase PAP2 family protein [Actinomycetota bacterium]